MKGLYSHNGGQEKVGVVGFVDMLKFLLSPFIPTEMGTLDSRAT